MRGAPHQIGRRRSPGTMRPRGVTGVPGESTDRRYAIKQAMSVHSPYGEWRLRRFRRNQRMRMRGTRQALPGLFGFATPAPGLR
jgi:hypothetical protein